MKKLIDNFEYELKGKIIGIITEDKNNYSIIFKGEQPNGKSK